MIFAAINWLSISINLLLVVFVIVCLLMALLILMQRPKQEGLGAAFGGGVTDQVFGARTTNVLQKGTVYLGSLFFLLSLTLAILIGKQTQQKSLLEPDKVVAEEKSDASADGADTTEIPVETPKSLVEELPAEEAPAAPDAKVEEIKEDAAKVVEEPAKTAEDAAVKVEEKVEEATDAAADKVEEVTEPAVEENKADKPE